MARRRMYGSASDSIRMAVITRVSTPIFSSTSCSASALMTVRQHAHVVGGDPVEPFPAGGGAADDVAAADHQRQLARPARAPP